MDRQTPQQIEIAEDLLEFLDGDLEAWLEARNTDDLRTAIKAAIAFTATAAVSEQLDRFSSACQQAIDEECVAQDVSQPCDEDVAYNTALENAGTAVAAVRALMAMEGAEPATEGVQRPVQAA